MNPNKCIYFIALNTQIDTKNRAGYYFNEIIRGFDINFDNILLDEKLYENISSYDIS